MIFVKCCLVATTLLAIIYSVSSYSENNGEYYPAAEGSGFIDNSFAEGSGEYYYDKGNCFEFFFLIYSIYLNVC